jgi:hypothetical protein
MSQVKSQNSKVKITIQKLKVINLPPHHSSPPLKEGRIKKGWNFKTFDFNF